MNRSNFSFDFQLELETASFLLIHQVSIKKDPN